MFFSLNYKIYFIAAAIIIATAIKNHENITHRAIFSSSISSFFKEKDVTLSIIR